MKKIRHIVLLAATALLLMNCKKDHSVLGVESQPEGDKLTGQVETYPVYAHTVPYDSIVSLGDKIKFLGCNNDPYFGRMEIGLYLNANMTASNLDFGSASVLSSAEIVLAVSPLNIVGYSQSALTYSVYGLDSVLNPKRAYYASNNRLHNKNQLLALHTTTFTNDNGTFIKIPIDPTYATAILKNPQYLVSNETFQANYKGFYITASAGFNEGIIYECEVEHEKSGFYLHYKAGSAATDTLQTFRFSFSGASSVKYNTSKFTPLPSLQTQFKNDTTLGAQNLFLKGMGATRLKVQIPFLQNYSDSFAIAVNRAEVIFNIDQEFVPGSGTYNRPLKLALLPLDSIGRETLSLDQRSSAYIGRYDGNYDDVNHRYIFNIPLHAQAIFKGQKKNCGFYLVIADPGAAFRRDNYVQRVIFSGSNTSLKPIINLSYTRLKNN